MVAMDPFDSASVVASTTGSGVAHGTGSLTTSSGTTGRSQPTPSPGSFPQPPLQTPEPAATKSFLFRTSRIVSWSDRGRKRFTDQEKYTFYRDPTPPPPPTFDQPSLKGEALIFEEAYDYRYDHVAPRAPIPVPRVCGVQKNVFLTLITAMLLLVVLAVGIGAGVGIGVYEQSNDIPDGQNDSGQSNSSTSPSSSNASPPTSTAETPSPSSSASSTRSSPEYPTTVTSNPAITTLVTCPAANDTTFNVPDSTVRFQRFCGIDYTGRGNAVDLAHVWTPTMEDCIMQCAGYTGCEACSWGVIEDDPGSFHRCWMKKDIRNSRKMRDGWAFAVLLND